MQVTFDDRYITQAYGSDVVAMIAWAQLSCVSVNWFAGKPYWLLAGGSARLAIVRGCDGERALQDALVQLHNFDAPKARQALASGETQVVVVWRR